MGVGAVFVSTMALTRLPTPHSPPENEQELLAAVLQVIVSFVVMGSILFRMSGLLLHFNIAEIPFARWTFNSFLLSRRAPCCADSFPTQGLGVSAAILTWVTAVASRSRSLACRSRT